MDENTCVTVRTGFQAQVSGKALQKLGVGGSIRFVLKKGHSGCSVEKEAGGMSGGCGNNISKR